MEPKTRLYHAVQKGQQRLPGEEIEAAMFEEIIESLSNASFKQYEISSFSKASPSLHNTLIWQDGDYLGIGSGAHSKYDNTRYGNLPRLKTYLEVMTEARLPPRESYPYEDKRDFLLMGMRLLKGVSLKTYQTRYHCDFFTDYPNLRPLLDQGFLVLKNDHLALSQKGMMVGNEIFKLF